VQQTKLKTKEVPANCTDFTVLQVPGLQIVVRGKTVTPYLVK